MPSAGAKEASNETKVMKIGEEKTVVTLVNRNRTSMDSAAELGSAAEPSSAAEPRKVPQNATLYILIIWGLHFVVPS